MPTRQNVSVKKLCLALLVVTFMIYAFSGPSVFAYNFSVQKNGMCYKWELGENSASSFNPNSPPETPGEATWSVMPAGLLVSPADDNHPANVKSFNLIGMTGLPDVNGLPYEIWAIKWAFGKWRAKSGFQVGCKVQDGADLYGVNNNPDVSQWTGNGASNARGGNKGDIRIGCYTFGAGRLGHANVPLTEDLVGPDGNRGGDIHFADNYTRRVTWVDNPNCGDPIDENSEDYMKHDFATVVLHEVGHALGLGHSNDNNSVMAMYKNRKRAQRELTQDDIDGIQAIYGKPSTDSCSNNCHINNSKPEASIASLWSVNNAQIGQSSTLWAKVENTGYPAMPSDAKVWFYVSGPGYSGWAGSTSVASLATGETRWYYFDLSIPVNAQAGIYNYWAVVFTSSESISSWSSSQTFTVTNNSSAQINSLWSVNAQCGQSSYLWANVKNTGYSVLPSDAKVWFYVSGPGYSRWVGSASVANLAADESQWYYFDWPIPGGTQAGTYNYWAIVFTSDGSISSWSTAQNFTLNCQ